MVAERCERWEAAAQNKKVEFMVVGKEKVGDQPSLAGGAVERVGVCDTCEPWMLAE